MVRGRKVGYKRNIRRRVRSEEKGSDESDEDYMVGEDEECDESDEYCSLDGDESEEGLGEFEEDEEEEDEEKVKKVVRSKKARKGVSGRKINGVKKPRKKRRVSYKEEDDDDYEDDDDDEEFTLDEIDCVDDEDELPVTKKNKKVGRSRLQEKGLAKGRKRKRNSKVLKKPMRKKPRNNHRLRTKAISSNESNDDKNLVVQEKSNKISGHRKRILMANSDSDFVSSGSSDYEYTISEEEREQMREASEFCRRLSTSLRSSSSSKRLHEEEALCPQRKRPGRKGKEKVEDLKNEVGKQVCGICLSEEVKKTVRGTLNCCSHYFCFACIMEWSKVESRCPLCKQRFVTISKPARSNTGFDLRTVVIQVPERDQVYHPSEEELRGYLDPYESVICTECHQGGDDALMLLCDLCDSPAHTYCVGHGHEVPEGNWYCEGCRPAALGPSNPQGLNPAPDQRTNNNLSAGSSPVVNVREGIDLNLMYVPDTPLTQGNGFFSSPRRPAGDFQTASPASGSGAFTVSERRRIQRQIHHILNNRMSQLGGRNNGISSIYSRSFFGSEIDWVRETASQRTITPERVASHNTYFEGRLQDNTRPLVHNTDPFSARSSHLRGQVIQNPTSTSFDDSGDGMFRAELPGTNVGNNSRLGYEQLHLCSNRSSIGSDASMSPYAYREVSHFNVQKEQLQSMVRSHLKSLSRGMELDYSTFKDIARSSTHTILAACGLEHRRNEVHPVELPSICNHIERMAGGQMSLMKGHCLSCFDSFVGNVVKKIMNTRVP